MIDGFSIGLPELLLEVAVVVVPLVVLFIAVRRVMRKRGNSRLR